MPNTHFLKSSLITLDKITDKTYNKDISPTAKAIWHKHLRAENPLWKFVTAKPFLVNEDGESAHVIAMVDSRLPDIGLVGFFACTNKAIGIKALKLANNWLKQEHGIKTAYGPINGTITRDYRLNLSHDFLLPGEPVNPPWYIETFKEAGFKVFNNYVSGISKHYQLFIRFLTVKKIPKEYSHITLRSFDINNQLVDLKKYHLLMNAIFPAQSIYCPVLSWEERVYNVAENDPIFDPDYTYFLEDGNKPVGFIVAHTYNNQLVIKTIGVLPNYQGKNLSTILIKKVHDQANKDGLSAAIYSTIRVGNTVYKMKRPGVKVYRKYITLSKDL
jgi:GNAT superfamily N-acetyltransferase